MNYAHAHHQPEVIAGESVNDTHSQLNPTWVSKCIRPRSIGEVLELVREARAQAQSLSIAGGRHAMGGQQFLSYGTLVDMNDLNKVINFDSVQGLVEVEAGLTWPDLITYLRERQHGSLQWTIAQ